MKSLAIWLALGLLGIGLAVAIALVARNLADQPVGIAGEPVSAGRALDPPRDRNASSNPGRAKAAGKKQTNEAQLQPEPQYTPPVVVAPSEGDSNPVPDNGSGSSGDSSSDDSDESHGSNEDGHDSDDD